MRLPKRLLSCAVLVATLLPPCTPTALQGQTPQPQSQTQEQPTRITIGTRVVRRNVKRFGINLGGQNFYDSGQILRNLVARNPGFQGQTWQSILRCTTFTRTTCTAHRTAWPSGFLTGATFQVATGPASGTRGTVRTANANANAYTVQFASPLSTAPADGDYLIVRSLQPSDPTAGWWTTLDCGAMATAEIRDLPPNSPARQALRIDAATPCQRATLNSYFDSTPGRSFVRLSGPHTLRFLAKPLTAQSTIQVRVAREAGPVFLNKAIPLQAGWHTYTVPFNALGKPTEKAGTAGLSFTAAATSLLLADVSLTADSHNNPTAFRDDVVDTLRDLHPGILRYMDSGTDFGTSLDDWLTPPAGRQRTGYSLWSTRQQDISLGLQEFLTLAHTISTSQSPTEPWISLPVAFSPQEAHNLVDYLASPPTTAYGSLRARLGHSQPWTQSFPRIHLELGNEVWNRGSFAGATIDDPAAYAQRAAAIFRAMRSTPGFTPARFDLVAGSFFEVPAHTAREAAALHGAADTLSVAPYLFSHFNDASSTEAVFGPMLAQPEQWTTIGGLLRQQADDVHATSPATRLSLYEVNLGTATGAPAITQADIDRTVPSTGAALAVSDLMLLALRDLDITEQCFFALTEFRNGFTSPGGAGPARTTPLFGAVVDMGGATDRRRPSFYALRLLNQTILANLIQTETNGADPTWTQPASTNDHIALPQTHLLQSFAFGEPGRRSLIVLNLSRTRSLSVLIDGVNAPRGTVQQTVLTSAHITDSNEDEPLVSLRTSSTSFDPATQHLLPPFSMTAYTWRAQ